MAGYECKPWPYSGLCGMAGFKPGPNPIGLAPLWEMAWTDEGHVMTLRLLWFNNVSPMLITSR